MEDIRPIPAAPVPAEKSQAEQLITALSVTFVQVNDGFHGKSDPQQGAAALVHLQAMFLAAIPDRETRKVYRKSMDKMLSRTIAKLLAEQEKGNG